ncbi:MAG: conjugal transfer protein [Lachnospiraceae bacterium]|nr:conjugal transfer protein [Lachnospiraceae bacterium]
MDEKKVKIYSYNKVWRVEKKIYSISNIPLPTPINPYDLLAFVGVALFMFVLGTFIPVTARIPTVIRFIAIPYGVANYAMKKKLDGKNPIKYFVGCVIYFFSARGTYLQMFKKYADRKKEKISLKWNCSMGMQQ